MIEFNPAAQETFGYSRADALGRPISELIVPPALRARHREGFERYLKTGDARVLDRRIEIEGMRADGTTFPIELAITEVRLPHRQLGKSQLKISPKSRCASGKSRLPNASSARINC